MKRTILFRFEVEDDYAADGSDIRAAVEIDPPLTEADFSRETHSGTIFNAVTGALPIEPVLRKPCASATGRPRERRAAR